MVKDALNGQPIPLTGTRSKGTDVTVRINRDYLAKAFDFGINDVGFIDAMSPMRFTREGRTLVVMPLRVAATPTSAEPARQ